MKTVVHLDGNPVVLKFKGFEDEVDVDELLKIDYSNLYGEAVTIAPLFNHVGILKASSEKKVNERKMELEVFESELDKRLRDEAAATSQKITEKSIEKSIVADKGYQIKRKNYINALYEDAIIDAMLKATSSKDKKLNNLVRGVSPKELFDELMEGTINNILIKKSKSIVGGK
jgi:predicted transcriptional regulator